MGRVAVYWDMDSCPLPPPADPFLIMGMANALLHNFNIQTTLHAIPNPISPNSNEIDFKFSAYKFSSSSPSEEEIELVQTVVNSGINLQTLHSGRIDEIEKMILADALLWAMDVPPPANIIFILGNVDFSYVFYKLRERSYNVFLVCASVGQMPHGMLSAANDCLGWSTFLKSLEQSEEKMHLPSNLHGWDPGNYQAFSNSYPSSVSTVSSKEREDCHSTSAFNYVPENYLMGQSFIGGQESTQFGISPLNEAVSAILQPPEGHGFHGHGFKCQEKPMDPAVSRHKNQKPAATTLPKKTLGSMAEFKAWLRQVVNRKENENGYNISPIRIDFEKTTGKNLDLDFLGFQKILNLLEQCKDVVEVKEVKKGCHLAFPVKRPQTRPFKTNNGKALPNPMKGKPESSPRTQPSLNPKPNLKAEADQNSMPKAKSNPNPMKGKPENSRMNPNSQPNLKTIPKTEAEAEAAQNSLPKAEKKDFVLFLIHMVYNGSFSEGFLMSKLPKEFEVVSKKCLDLQHLGYKKLTNLLEEYSDIVSVDSKGPGPSRIFPASGLTISNLNVGRTSEEISINMVEFDLAEQKAGVEINNNSAGGSAKNSSDNRGWEEYITDEHLCCENTELAITGSISLPMNLSSWPSTSFTPAEDKAPAFQGYCNNSDSSESPPGLHVSEWEDQLPDKVRELCSHGDSSGLEASECSKQFLPSIPKHGNIPIGNAVHTEISVFEALQNLRLNRENESGKQAATVIEPAARQNSSYDNAVGVGLLDGISSQLESSILNPKVSCNIPSIPLQRQPKERNDCSGDLQCGTGLDCKVNKQNEITEVKEETNANSIVPPGGSIMQAAGRGLKTFCEFTIWKKNQ